MVLNERPELIELLFAGQNELALFAQKVAQRNGSIPVLVHPFFRQNYPPDYKGYVVPVRENYEKERDRFIKICLDRQVPLVIFEQESEYDLLADRLGLTEKPSSVYTVKTAFEDPRPLYGGPFADYSAGWSKLAEILQDTDVKHLTVGGQYMILKKFEGDDDTGVPKLKDNFPPLLRRYLGRDRLSVERWTDLTTNGCAGTTARLMALCGFDVAISPISSPHNLKTL